MTGSRRIAAVAVAVVLLVAAAAFVLWLRNRPAPALSGSPLRVSGSLVLKLHRGDAASVDAPPGAPLSFGDRLEAPQGGRIVIADAEIDLSPGSEVLIESDAGQPVLRVVRGSIAGALVRGGRLSIAGPAQIVPVVGGEGGGRFGVRVGDDGIVIDVTQGSLTAGGSPLAPGQRRKLGLGTPTIEPDAPAVAATLQGRQGRFRAGDGPWTPLASEPTVALPPPLTIQVAAGGRANAELGPGRRLSIASGEAKLEATRADWRLSLKAPFDLTTDSAFALTLGAGGRDRQVDLDPCTALRGDGKGQIEVLMGKVRLAGRPGEERSRPGEEPRDESGRESGRAPVEADAGDVLTGVEVESLDFVTAVVLGELAVERGGRDDASAARPSRQKVDHQPLVGEAGVGKMLDGFGGHRRFLHAGKMQQGQQVRAARAADEPRQGNPAPAQRVHPSQIGLENLADFRPRSVMLLGSKP